MLIPATLIVWLTLPPEHSISISKLSVLHPFAFATLHLHHALKVTMGFGIVISPASRLSLDGRLAALRSKLKSKAPERKKRADQVPDPGNTNAPLLLANWSSL
jgi:hypothetical protein